MTCDGQIQREDHLMRIQRSAAGLCVALLLVAGLVSVPTSCDCGAGVPHGHSLFILAGHHHSSQGAIFGSQSGPVDHEHGHHTQESPSVEPQLMGRIMHSADRVAVAMPLFEATASTWQRISHQPYSELAADGRTVSPEPPPPRQHGGL